eukprot:8242495-Alexandrium_andersonii.AAC.1
MSASLVGSEMCIRDSVRATRRGARRPNASSRRGGMRCAGPRALFPNAVSYTHLTLPTICSV